MAATVEVPEYEVHHRVELDPKRTALIVVDMQNDFVSEGGSLLVPDAKGTVANICVHYTAASAALRWYRVVIPRDAVSARESFDLESSLRQTAFLFAGTITTTAALQT